MKVFCCMGFHSWRTLKFLPSRTPIGTPFRVLGVSVEQECARCGLVRVEGRWAGIYIATLSSGPQSERSATEVARVLQEAADEWVEQRRAWGLGRRPPLWTL